MPRMVNLHWTGHPFVDAGLAALAAAVQVNSLDDITADSLETAVKKLKQILLSDQALGIGVEGAFVRKALSQIFPNSELVNPANWKKGNTYEEKAKAVREKFSDELKKELDRAQQCLKNHNNSNGYDICNICGEKRPKSSFFIRRKDKMPLLEGIVNYYPAFSPGVRICGLCALATRFFPLSVMRTGVRNRLWFLHAQDLAISKRISEKYGWEHFNSAIAANKTLDFFSNWNTAGNEGTVLYVLYSLLKEMPDQLRHIYENSLPTTAYLFSNDNRGGYISALPIPHALMEFLALLQVKSHKEFNRFWKDLLEVSGIQGNDVKARIRYVESISKLLLNGESIIKACLDHEKPKLRGGWVGHRLYLKEVRELPESKLNVLECLGISIAKSDEFKKYVMELRTARDNELYGILLRYVKNGWLKHDEFYTLLAPNDYSIIKEIRDLLLAIIYDYHNCKEEGREFALSITTINITPDETLYHLQKIGKKLIVNLNNLKRWTGKLQIAKTGSAIRGIYLNCVRSGAMTFDDFVFLAPLGDRRQLWLLRDYLLAFLFEKVRELTEEEEEYSEYNENGIIFQNIGDEEV
ncbi:CRISPR-associated protein, Cst1 family [Acetomicrobium thermoterrenum DSM 13490]|uniref:CRISPR-associated protein, Cst1 family n=2 Tax=Acetomicrobium TaxID=49894 RepID=A0A1H3F3T7_9BACT|nr:CRISPR-associated protein, Cst1 family [Acetomicrobium thermoterrenum DSM 13490]